MRLNWMAGAMVAMMASGGVAGSMWGQSADWRELYKDRSLARGARIFVVTQAQPKLRQPCRIQWIDADRLDCAGHPGRTVKEYRKEDVLALIEPPRPEHLQWFWLKGMVSGVGLILAGALISGPVGVVAIVVGGLVVFAATGLVAFGTGDEPERLLYLQPGQALPFPLSM